MRRALCAVGSLLALAWSGIAAADLTVRTSDNTIVLSGDSIAPIGFQGVHLISAPEYRTITIANGSARAIVLNSISAQGDPDFSVCSADSGLNLWEKRPLAARDQSLAAGGTFDFHLDFCPLSGGPRKAVVTIAYDGAKTFSFTVTGRGRPENITSFSHGTVGMHKIWGGYDKNQDERPGGLVVDSAGNAYFCGSGKYLSSDKYQYDIFVGRINADGSLGWQKVYHSAYKDFLPDPSQNDESGGSANSIAMDDSGAIYVTGSVGNGANNAFLALLMKLNPADGSVVWQKHWFSDTKRLGSSDSVGSYAVDVSGDVVYMAGEGSEASSGVKGIIVAAFSARDGSTTWNRIINPNGNAYVDRGYAVRADGKGALYVAGYHGESTGSPFLCKLGGLESQPRLLWARSYGMGTGTSFNAMDVDGDGNVYLSADRRGATTYFSLLKVNPEGALTSAKTFPGTAGGRNNTKVVSVIGDAVYVGGKIGYSGLDTDQGDGLLVKLRRADLGLDWAAAYYTGTGALEVCEHHVKGIAQAGTGIIVYGQVYTGNANYYRYYGSWFDLPAALEDYAPATTDTTAKTTVASLPNAGLVDASKTGGLFEAIAPAANVELQDAEKKNQTTHGGQVDGDVFLMRIEPRP